MSIYTYLKSDHDEFNKLLKRIETLGPDRSEQKQELFLELSFKILTHSKAEEKIFYGSLRSEMSEDIQHAEKEHKEVEKSIKKLADEDAMDSDWTKRLNNMGKSLNHHIKEEEGKIFTKAKKILSDSQAVQLEHQMRREKEKLIEALKENITSL